MNSLPGISILIPTLNSERYLQRCLESVRAQNYPRELIEVIVADAGSIDNTLTLLSRYNVDRVVPNPGVTGEAARAILNRLATKELILSIDSDNYLVGSDWLRRMVEPLVDDPTVFASEPLRWDYNPGDPPINRYFALSGINDPVSLFIGNYGRYSYLTGKWTEMPHEEESHGAYFVACLQKGRVPTMGANGFLVRAAVVRQASTSDFYFDIDVVNDLVNLGYSRVGKVDVALGHNFVRDLQTFRRKTRRRIEDFLFWRTRRRYPWLSQSKWPLVRFSVETVLTIPILVRAFKGWLRVRDSAWVYHVAVCWITLWLYAWSVAQSIIRPAPHSRKGWQH